MRMSSVGLDLVKSFEGLYLNAYKCPAGVWTIGYGHTGKVNGKSIHSGMKISKAKATSLLQDDMRTFEKAVGKLVKVKLNQHQFDALVSFAFNCGAGNLQNSTLLKMVNAKKFSTAANEFLKWNKGGGRVLAGLTRRRQEERKLFLRPVAKKTTPYTFKKFVKELQGVCNLKKTGVASKALLRVLPTITPKKKNTDPVIKPLKHILKKKGYKISKINNIYDSDLKAAVIAYKNAHNFENKSSTIGEGFWKKILKL